MRGHGNVVLGDSVQQVVCGIYTEINGKLQAGALRVGTGQVEFLNAEEARNTTETNKKSSAAVGPCGSAGYYGNAELAAKGRPRCSTPPSPAVVIDR